VAKPAPGFKINPARDIHFEPSPRRVRVRFEDQWVADSTQTMLMYETAHLPVYYFPTKDIRHDLLLPTNHSSYCQYKGNASYWTIEVGDRKSENALWAYQDPFAEMAEIGLQNHCAFFWDKLDNWFEEDQEIFVHPRDPYKRVDVIPSSREIRVILGGKTVAASTQTYFVFETGLPTRYYVPEDDVRMDLLTPTNTRTRCPYKGIAKYWSADGGGSEKYVDIAWSYPEPVEECPRIRDLICFYNENVDAILVNGQEEPKPATRWSKL